MRSLIEPPKQRLKAKTNLLIVLYHSIGWKSTLPRNFPCVYRTKANAGSELSNILDASVFLANTSDDGRHIGAKQWEKRAVYLAYKGKLYHGIVSMMVMQDGRRRFYDLTKIKETDNAMQGHNALRNWGLSMLNIAQSGKEVNTSEKFSVRNSYEGLTDADFSENAEIYSYDFLIKQKPMQVVKIPAISEISNEGKVDIPKIIAKGKENAARYGGMKNGLLPVVNVYTGRNLNISSETMRHGMGGKIYRLWSNAQLSSVVGDIVHNGIPLNALKTQDRNAVHTYVLGCYGRVNNEKEAAILAHVDIQKNTVDKIEWVDLVHSLKGKIKKRSAQGANTSHYKSEDSSASEISIADFLEKVNTSFPSILSDDVQEHLHPDEYAEGYYTNSKLFSIKEETGKDPLAEVMRENAELKKLVQELRAKASGLRAEIPKAVVHRYARELKQQYGMSKISIKTIESYLTRAFGLMTSREAGDAAAGMEMLGDIAYTILNRGEALQKTAQERNTAIKAAEREKPCKAREKEKALISQDFLKECRQRDLNPQAFRRRILSPLRMPFRHAGRFRPFCLKQKFRKREKPTRSGAGQYSSGGAIQI